MAPGYQAGQCSGKRHRLIDTAGGHAPCGMAHFRRQPATCKQPPPAREELMDQPSYGNPDYTLTRRLTGTSLAAVVEATRTALAGEGFGVLTEIDIQATLAKKLGVEMRPYLILGACNPPLAHRALSSEPGIGSLLPCNVIVAEDPDGAVVVSTIDPVRMFSVVDKPEVAPIAAEVRARLERVLAALAPAD
jgi:uncharacterized protein (DUF302 family)